MKTRTMKHYDVYYFAGGIEDLRSSLRLNLHTDVAEGIAIRQAGPNEFSLCAYRGWRTDALDKMLDTHPQFTVCSEG